MTPAPTHDPSALRRAAEARLKARTSARPPQTEADLRRLEHELEVHQIELEMQNEELRATVAERGRFIAELEKTLAQVKQLRGLLPICAGCKKIRDDRGYWNAVELYVASHSEATFTHSLCPDCAEKYFPANAFLPENPPTNPDGG